MDNKSVERYAQQNFQAALREAFWRKAQTWLGRSCNDLLSFQEVFEHLKTQTQDNRSLQNVLLDHIVGSTGRSDDFDLAYYPRKNIIENRWVNVAKNQYLDRKLPPILLYKVGGGLFC